MSIDSRHTTLGSPAYALLTKCLGLREITENLQKIAESDTSVLILGESGTGKELIARAIHELSARREQRCVTLNCGAIAPSLIQAELFGHEKGAFTSAHKRQIGIVETAHKGTLFMDEIGELPLELQSNFLRLLQENCFERIGSNESIHVDVRIVSATNVDLEGLVAAGGFREDFFYRINVLTVKVPPLRERLQDVEVLAHHFLRNEVLTHRLKPLRFSHDAICSMARHAWPGNVRELRNRVRRAIVMCEQRVIDSSDLELPRSASCDLDCPSLAEARRGAEQHAINRSLILSNRNVTEAARLLKTSRLTLYRLMKKHGIQGLES